MTSEFNQLRQDIRDLKQSQITIAKSILDQVSNNQYNTDRLLNVLNNNMVTVFKAVSSIDNGDSQLREASAEALAKQYEILQEAQKINNKLMEANAPRSLQPLQRNLNVIAEEEKQSYINNAALLEAQLRGRNPADLVNNGVLLNTPQNFQRRLDALERQQQTDNLNQGLRNRNATDLVNSGVLLNTPQNFQTRLDALERQQQMDSLSRGLRNRPTKEHLLRQQQNVLRSQFEDTRNNLSRARNRDSISRGLRNRPALSDLVQQRVLPDAHNPVLAAQLNAMKLKQQQRLLAAQLQNRPDSNQLFEQGIMLNTASNFADQANALNKQKQIDSLNRSLRNRPNAQQLVSQNVLPDAQNALLAAQINQMKWYQNRKELEDQLQRRADMDAMIAQGHLMNTTDNYLQMGEALKAAQNRDFLNRSLKNRPDIQDLVAQNVLPDAQNPVVAAQVNRVKRRQQAAQLDEALQARKKQAQLVAEGIALNTSDNYMEQRQALEKSKQMDSLNRSLRNRPNKEQLVAQQVLPDAENPVIAANLKQRKLKQSKAEMDERLKNRLDAQELVQRGYLMNTSANFDDVAQQLQKQQKNDTLNKSLKNRPDVNQLVDQRVLPDANNPILAAKINEQKLRQQRVVLEQQLLNRKKQAELLQQGYLWNTTSNFDSRADELAKRRNMDLLSRGLRNRPEIASLVDQRILFDAQNPILAAELQAVRRRQQQNVLDQQLLNRKAAQDLVDSGYLFNTNQNYQTAADALERAQVVDALNRGLRQRPNAAQLKQQQILADSNVYGTLQANALALEQEFQANRLAQQLRERQAQQDLVSAGYLLNTQENWELQRRLLERQKKRDSLSQNLRNRPPPSVLRVRNSMSANEVSSQNMSQYNALLRSYKTTMDQAQLDLLNAQKADAVHQSLRNRPATDELAARGIYKSPMQAKRESLTQSRRADNVNQQLRNRPNAEELKDAGIYKSTMDQARENLASSKMADNINQSLRDRPSTVALAEAGIYKSTMDQARDELLLSQLSDNVNQQLRTRPTASALSDAGIYRSTMDQARIDLSNAQKADGINQALQAQPDISELKAKQIYKTAEEEAQLREQNQERNQNLNTLLTERPSTAAAAEQTPQASDANANTNNNTEQDKEDK